MARVPTVTRDKVPQQYQEAFDEITASRGGVITSGPNSVMINSPEMAHRAGHLSEYLRTESTLAKKIQELAMLTTARGNDCQYIWNAHAAAGRKAGLSDALVDALRDKKPIPTGTPADEATVVNYGLEFFRTHKVSQRTFDVVLKQLGAQGLTELTTLMGYYALLAFNANSFMIDLPTTRTEQVLPI